MNIVYTAVFLMAVSAIVLLNSSEETVDTLETSVPIKVDRNISIDEVDSGDYEEVIESKIAKISVETDVNEKSGTESASDIGSYNANALSEEDRELNRIVAAERREIHRIQRLQYDQGRRQWQRDLQDARREAKKSGDYTKYEALKAEEPTKSKRSK